MDHTFDHTNLHIYNNNVLVTAVDMKAVEEGESQQRVADSSSDRSVPNGKFLSPCKDYCKWIGENVSRLKDV